MIIGYARGEDPIDPAFEYRGKSEPPGRKNEDKHIGRLKRFRILANRTGIMLGRVIAQALP